MECATGSHDFVSNSLIENTGFRELKQGWLIKKIPKKKESGVVSHVFLTCCMYNFTNAYRTQLGEKLTEREIRQNFKICVAIA